MRLKDKVALFAGCWFKYEPRRPALLFAQEGAKVITRRTHNRNDG